MEIFQTVEIFDIFMGFYNIGYLKVLPVICVIGCILSLINLIVFLNPKLKEKIYFYLMIKSLIELVILVCGALLPLLQNVTYITYFTTLFQIVLYKVLSNALFLFVSIMEISITFNRYFIIKSTQKLLVKKKDKILVFIFGIVSFALFIPICFAYNIVEANGKFSFENSDFGNTKFFEIYLECINFSENLLTVFVLLPSNIIVLIQYRRFLSKKKTIINFASRLIRGQDTENAENKRISKLVRSQRKFTRMIIILSFLFIFARLCTAGFEIFNIYNKYVHHIKTYEICYLFLNIIISFNIYFMLSVNFFIYYFFNKPFRQCFHSIICFNNTFNFHRN